MKKPKTRIKELRGDLRYAQMQVRLDVSAWKRSTARAKEIAAKMRVLQHETAAAALAKLGKERE